MTVPAAENLRHTLDVNMAAEHAVVAADLLDAIDALHQPQYRELGAGVVRLVCSCGARDCPTARLLHPAPEEDK